MVLFWSRDVLTKNNLTVKHTRSKKYKPIPSHQLQHLVNKPGIKEITSG